MTRLGILVLVFVLGLGGGLLLGGAPELTSLMSAGGPDTADDDDESAADDDDDDDALPVRTEVVDGRVRLRLSPAEIDLAGIRVAAAAAASGAAERRLVGQVVDARGLLAAARRRDAATRELAVQRELVAALAARVARVRALADDGRLGAGREAEVLALELLRERRARTVLEAELGAAETALAVGWGAGLAARIERDPELVTTLTAGAAALVGFRERLDRDQSAPQAVFVGLGDERAAATPAQVIGPMAAVTGGASGAAWLVLVERPALAAGMRVDVWLAAGDGAESGFLVPATAIVWHGGRRWYFAALGDGRFERRSLPDALADEGGMVVAEAPGDIVIAGAQTLLAEEHRGLIPDEDDD